ncbi:MAG: phosphoglucomutase/phosphomannomutase family protein, partial [Candidatus Omnitrophica bacterium]|nr:phosphoglucomutase/phosphomannomutase family protein [Candidatus Omnitrophota bacterium]
MSKIVFGTDGWRGVISKDFTFDNVKKVAQAIADYYKGLQSQQPARIQIAVGYDTRFLSDKYAELLAEVLSGNSISVILSDRPIPTPMLSFTVRNRKLTAGVMVTASHNPKEYNGIKIKTSTGAAAGLEVTRQIEKLANEVSLVRELQIKDKIKDERLDRDYIRFIRSYIDLKKIKTVKLKVLVDVMHGSGNRFIAEILKDAKIKFEFVRAEINPSFGGKHPEPIEEN